MFRPHNQSKFLLDIQISSWILELQTLEHSISNIDQTNEGIYLYTPEE